MLISHLTRHSMMFREADGTAGGASLLSGESGGGGQQQQQQKQGDADPYVSFLANLPDDLADAKPTLEKYKSLHEAARGLFSANQLLGKKANAVVIPGEKSSPEEVSAFRKALGIPEKADAYQLKPAELPDGVEVREENLVKFAEIAHKHNITPAAMQAIIGEFISQRAADVQASDVTVAQEREKSMAVLRDAWKGQDIAENLTLAKRVATTLGVPHDSPGLADPSVVLALAKAGKMLAEDKLHKGGDVSGLMSGPARAKSIRTNPSDPLYAKYQEGDAETVAYARQLDQAA